MSDRRFCNPLMCCAVAAAVLLTSNPVSAKEGGSAAAGQSNALPLMSLHTVRDDQLGMDAISILVPDNWMWEGYVNWNMGGSVSNPVVYGISCYAQDSFDAVNIFPTSNMVWFGPNCGMGMYYSEGSMVNGAVVMEPRTAADYILGSYVPMLQQQVGRVDVEWTTDLPELAQATYTDAINTIQGDGSAYQWDADAAKVRLSYEIEGWGIEEDIVAATMYCYDPMNDIMVWRVMSLNSCGAAAGELDSKSQLFATIVASFREEPAWHAAVMDVVNELVARQAQQVPSQVSSYAGTPSSYAGICTDSWESRSEVHDQAAASFSDAILGVDSYSDSFTGYEIDVPTGQSCWGNGMGDYIYNDDPLFDPNVDLEYSGVDWYSLD